jgi:hypothetical protein
VLYEHNNGVHSRVKLHQARLGVRKIRIANFPSDMSREKIKQVLSIYGLVMDVKDDFRSNAYRYKVFNGVRIALIDLTATSDLM